jgi:hypothetical protein
MLDLVYLAGQVLSTIGLAYGAYVSLAYSIARDEPKQAAAPVMLHHLRIA